MKNKTILLLLFAYFFQQNLFAQVNLQVIGNWDYSLPITDILEAGNDFTGTYESNTSQVNLSITDGTILIGQDYNWRVDVRVGQEDWHPNLDLSIRRTGDGVTVNDGMIVGGEVYQTLTTVNQTLMEGNKNRTLIPVQYQLRNVSVTIPAKTYYTTVIYTVTEL